MKLIMVYFVQLILYASMLQDGKLDRNTHLMSLFSLSLKKSSMVL